MRSSGPHPPQGGVLITSGQDTDTHSGEAMWRPREEKTTVHKPRGEAPRNQTCQHLDLGLPASKRGCIFISP